MYQVSLKIKLHIYDSASKLRRNDAHLRVTWANENVNSFRLSLEKFDIYTYME